MLTTKHHLCLHLILHNAQRQNVPNYLELFCQPAPVSDKMYPVRMFLCHKVPILNDHLNVPGHFVLRQDATNMEWYPCRIPPFINQNVL
jgi:hypothetical protein